MNLGRPRWLPEQEIKVSRNMFTPKTERIKKLAETYPSRISELENVFNKPTNIYIDFANVIGWQERIGWHINFKRLKQLLDSFDAVRETRFYSGTLAGDVKSADFINEIKGYGYIVITKPVKVMRFSIDTSSIPSNSPEIIKQFIRPPLLQKLSIETIEFLNAKLKELNQQGIMYLEDLKFNFDVEIGRDMLIAYTAGHAENFILWSGDSDFADPVKQLLDDGKKVTLFATARKVSVELNELRNNGLFIFDIQKIKDFICWPREDERGIKSKRDSIT